VLDAAGASVPLASGLDGSPDPLALQGSGRYVAIRGQGGLLAGSPPRSLSLLASGPTVRPHGCSSWRADPTQRVQFAVSESKLILPASAACTGFQPSAPRPLFAYAFATKRWRILRRLRSTLEPQLSAAGHWLAIGEQTSLTAMHLEVLDLRTGKPAFHAAVRPGYLDIDSAGEVLIITPTPLPSAPLPNSPECCNASYVMSWVSRHSRAPRQLTPTATGMPRISNGQVAYQFNEGETSQLQLTSLRSGTTQSIVGFREPLRHLYAFDLANSELAWLQTETVPLPASQVSCYSRYAPTGPKTVHIDSLKAPAIPIAAPPLPPEIAPVTFERCGPAPP
jgi:hypothetical protein